MTSVFADSPPHTPISLHAGGRVTSGWAGGIPQLQVPLDGLGWDAKPVEAEGPGGGPSLLSSADRI